MGFSIAASQCLVAPPYVLAGMLMLSTAWVGDKYRMRAPVLIFNSVITLIGLPVMGFASSNGVRYFGVFLTTAGANANIPCSMAYQANNIRGQWTRAFASATLVGFGGIGGIAGSLIFRSQDAPDYIPGIWGAMAYVEPFHLFTFPNFSCSVTDCLRLVGVPDANTIDCSAVANSSSSSSCRRSARTSGGRIARRIAGRRLLRDRPISGIRFRCAVLM
jgi:hypothetical protein